MTEIKEMMVVNRINDSNKVYMVYIVTDTKVKLCPYGEDSKDSGARRGSVSKTSFWKIYEPYSGDL